MVTLKNFVVSPFFHAPTGKSYNRIIVKPHRASAQTHDDGLITPERENVLCEMGTVEAVCPGSEFQPGDEIVYAKIDRSPGEYYDSVSVEGQEYDVLFENEVWSRNEEPYNRIFVTPVTDYKIGEEQLVFDKNSRGITQKGIVHSAPEKYLLRAGDRIEYRKQEGGIYPTVNLNGKELHVLFEGDIFLVNDQAAPFRIIVKINLAAQAIKRRSAEGGLVRSPLFMAMLYNMQIAEIVGIGEEAKKMYPKLRKGDTAIIHHSIESQPYRVVGVILGKNNMPLYEYRIINCWEEKEREIFGKMVWEHSTGKIVSIRPLNKSIFCEWEFEPLEEVSKKSPYLDIMGDMRKYKNLDDFKHVLAQKKAAAAEKAKHKVSGIRMGMNLLDPLTQKDQLVAMDAELKRIQNEETRTVQGISRNHMVICKKASLSLDDGELSSANYLICTHEELYPINLLGKKFIIAHPNFVIATTNKSMNVKIEDIQPKKGILFIHPIEEELGMDLVVPQGAREKPQRGKVVAAHPEDIYKEGQEVLFRKGTGLEQEIGGVKYFILRENDCLAGIATPV